MKQGLVFKIQKFCTDDGPGIRTTVFLKGCPLNCMWCHNPEGLSNKPIIAVDFSKCISCGACTNFCECHKLIDGKHFFSSNDCILCSKCIDICKMNAIEFCGHYMSVDEVIKNVLADKMFYLSSNGGITLSGGEPLMQSGFALDILKSAKENGINTCIETSCGVSFNNIEKVMDYVDLFLCDVKETRDDKHIKYIGISNNLVLENIKKLDKHKKSIKLRCPIIPSVNDDYEHFDNLIELYNSLDNVVGIQLMPYHMLGQGKSERYGIDLDDKAFIPADDLVVNEWNSYINARINIKK